MSTEEQEGLDNTTAMSRIIETGDEAEVRMLLGDRSRIRPAGIIRPGIKTPVSTCTPAQKELYQKLLDDGQGFDFIDKEMLKLEKKDSTRKSCLRPSNCDYFVCRDEDFKNSADAEYIRKNYASSDGKLRRFPVWLSQSSLEAVAAHNFRAFDGFGNLRCVSFYDGGNLRFRYITKDTKLPAKESDWKVLESSDEDDATKACGYAVQFGAMYRVYVPGQRSAGEIVIPSRSWNGVSETIGTLKRVKSLLGRYDGLFQKKPFLEMVKTRTEIRHEGKQVYQWIAEIQLSVDPMELVQYVEDVQPRAATALSMFNPPAGPVKAKVEPPVKNILNPTTTEPVAETKKELPAEIQTGINALVSLGEKASLTRGMVDRYVKTQTGTLMEECSYEGLKSAYQNLRKELHDDVKHVQDSLREADNPGTTTPDPEIEAMLNEIWRLADDLNLDHLRAHLIAISGGVAPEDQSLIELQQAYREIEARLGRDPHVFQEEIANDFAMGGE